MRPPPPAGRRNPSLRNLTPGETARNEWLFLLANDLLAEHSRLFLLCGAGSFNLFLRGFLLSRLRGFIAHNFNFIRPVDSPAACMFLRRRGHYAR